MKRSMPSPTDIFSRAWGTLSEHLGMMVVAVLAGIGVFIAFYIVLMIAMVGLAFALGPNSIAFQIGNNVVGGVFGVAILWGYVGYFRFNLDIIRGAEPDLMTLFNQWRLVPNYFLTNAVVQIVMFAWILPVSAVAAGPVAALWDKANPFPALAVGFSCLFVAYLAFVPVFVGSSAGAMFSIDRELDPLASMMGGLRAIRGKIGWCYSFAIMFFFFTMVSIIPLMTCVGILVVLPFSTLVMVHAYLALAESVEAELVGEIAKAAPETAIDEAPDTEALEEGEPTPGKALGTPVDSSNPYSPPSAKVDRPATLSGAPGRPAPAPLPQDAKRYRPDAPAGATGPAIVCLIPWILAGGNPFSGAMIGYLVARMIGYPDWAGAIAGFGALMLCGVAALVVMLLGNRGHREAIVDQAGVAVDGNQFWTGVRLQWSELRGFRISPRGVELHVKGFWGYFWRPIVPSRERETHDLVETLEARGVMRVA